MQLQAHEPAPHAACRLLSRVSVGQVSLEALESFCTALEQLLTCSIGRGA